MEPIIRRQIEIYRESPEGYIGRWVLTHSAVVRINDVLYMHGGLGPSFASYDKAVMNKAVVAALRHEPEPPGAPHDILWAEEGPLWYRGFAQHAGQEGLKHG